MENNPYNQKIAEQLREINTRYLSHLNRTGKQVVDSDLVPLTKPNIHYEAGGPLSGLLGMIGLGKKDIKKLEGAGFFDSFAKGFSMPFELVNKVLGGEKAKKMVGAGLLSGPLSLFGLGKEGGLIKIGKGKAHYGKQSKSVMSGNVGGIGARAVGSGNAGMEGAGIFDDIGDLVKNVTSVALPIAKLVGIGKEGGKKGGKRGRPRKAGAVGVEAMAEHRNALTGGKKRGRPSKKAQMEAGGPLSGLLGMIGLGEEKAGGKKRGRPSKKAQMEAGGPLSGLLGMIGLGEEKAGGKKRGRPSKKAQMEAGGIFDDILGTVGKVVKTTADVAPDALKLFKMVKGKGMEAGAKKSSPWIAHCKAFAKKHKMSYRDALRDARCKSSYKK